jgi:DNA-directed RNA polymerase specialized sigma24 family protein
LRVSKRLDFPLRSPSEMSADVIGICLEDESALRRAQAVMLRCCLSAGLATPDAEDVTQDVWIWVLRNLVTLAPITVSLVAAATFTFARRHRRGLRRNAGSEIGALIERLRCRDYDVRGLEAKILLDEIETRLPATEARILHLSREGRSLSAAMKACRIPRGSADYYRKRLIRDLKALAG